MTTQTGSTPFIVTKHYDKRFYHYIHYVERPAGAGGGGAGAPLPGPPAPAPPLRRRRAAPAAVARHLRAAPHRGPPRRLLGPLARAHVPGVHTSTYLSINASDATHEMQSIRSRLGAIHSRAAWAAWAAAARGCRPAAPVAAAGRLADIHSCCACLRCALMHACKYDVV